MFALHFLSQMRVGSPWALIESARKLRDLAEVQELRKWLAKWESYYGAADMKKRDKALTELKRLEFHLNILRFPPALMSVVRPVAAYSPDGSVSFTLDPLSVSDPLSWVRARLSRRAVFLSTLSKRLSAEESLGRHLFAMLGRAIIT
jgi:hypothetical protein